LRARGARSPASESRGGGADEIVEGLARGRDVRIARAGEARRRRGAARGKRGRGGADDLVLAGPGLGRPAETRRVTGVVESHGARDIVDQGVPGIPGTLVVEAVVDLRRIGISRLERIVAVPLAFGPGIPVVV